MIEVTITFLFLLTSERMIFTLRLESTMANAMNAVAAKLGRDVRELQFLFGNFPLEKDYMVAVVIYDGGMNGETRILTAAR